MTLPSSSDAYVSRRRLTEISQANKVSQILDVVGGVIDLEAFKNGWAEHDSNLSVGEYSSEQKWYDTKTALRI